MLICQQLFILTFMSRMNFDLSWDEHEKVLKPRTQAYACIGSEMRRRCTRCRFIKFTLLCGGFLGVFLCYISLRHSPSKKEVRPKESRPSGQRMINPKVVCNGDSRRSNLYQIKWKLTDLVYEYTKTHIFTWTKPKHSFCRSEFCLNNFI